MDRPTRRPIATASAVNRLPDQQVIPSVRESASARQGAPEKRHKRDREALLAILSFGAVLMIIVLSVAMKLWMG
jgi:hypothetical protein